MKKRQIIINGKFQLGMAFSFAALSALIMTVVIIILSGLLITNNSKLRDISVNQQQLADTQIEIFKTLIHIVETEDISKLHISAPTVKQDNERNLELVNKNNAMIREITVMNNRIIALLIGSAVIQSLIIFYIMLKRSHRISGPMFLLNRYIDEMKQGNYPEIRPLRANDDFHDIFDNFRELIEGQKKNSIKKP